MRRVRLLLLVPAAALAVAACGSSSTAGSGAAAATTPAATTPAATTSAAPADNGVSALSAEQILTKAKTALGAADAVHIAGAGTDSDSGSAIKLDMRYGKDGATGTLTIDGQRLDLLRVGDDAYIKGSKSFWTTFANGSVAKLLGDKYVKTPLTDERFADLASFTDLSASADGFLEPDGTITRGEKTTVGGRPAIGLVSKDKTDGTLYVATTGRPYPLSIEAEGNSLTFTEYGKAVPVAVPPTAQIVDADTLPGS